MSQRTQGKITVYPLSLNGDTFNAFKSDFDQLLRQLIAEMEKRESEDATISVKFQVKLAPDQARDFQANGYDGMRDIIKPSFKHEISTVMQVKNKKSGNVGGNMELVWDKKLRQYIMRPIDNGQTTFFDEDGNNTAEYEVSGEDSDKQAVLPVADSLGLPAPDRAAAREEEDTVYPYEIRDNPFDWLKQFVEQKLNIMCEDGAFVAKNYEGIIVFSSAVPQDSCQFCPAQVLERFELCHLVVHAHYVGTPDDPGNLVGISVWCDEEDITIGCFDAPNASNSGAAAPETDIVEEAEPWEYSQETGYNAEDDVPQDPPDDDYDYVIPDEK